MDEEINPRQCGMEVNKEVLDMSDERFLYDKLMMFLDEEKMVASHETHEEDTLDSAWPVSCGKTSELEEDEDEGTLPYIEQFEKEVQNEIILLHSVPFKQDLKRRGIFWNRKFNRRLPKLFQSKQGSQVLKASLNAWKERAASKFGYRAGVNNDSNITAVPCWKSDCSKKTQLIEIHLKCLRGIKDKVPHGSYRLKISIHRQQGGNFFSRSKVNNQRLAGNSVPVRHNGNFYDVEISFDQSIHVDVPDRTDEILGETLIFELFCLQGTSDQVVGWGAFPLCNNNLNIADGKFKCPLLRGHYDINLDSFQKIDRIISTDLDHWLCNLYFQIIKLPWYSDDYNGYEVCPQPSSNLSAYLTITEKNCISKKEIIGQPLTPLRDSDTHKESIPTVEKEVGTQFNAVSDGEHCTLKETQKKRKNHLLNCFQQTKQNNPNDGLGQRSSKIGPDADGVLQSYQEELEKHRFSVCCHPAIDSRESTRFMKHFSFGIYGVFSELGRGPWYSWGFWSNVLLISFLWFIRLYLHYFGQWILLQVFAVPITKFQFHLYTVNLCYQNSLVQTSEEMAMVVVGPLTLNTVMLLLIVMQFVCQLLFGSFPSCLSKLTMAWGFWTVLDPLAVFMVDAFLGRLHYSADKPIADCAKLYWLFLRREESGIPGALITGLLYAVLLVFSSTTLYLYFVRLYNEGWLLDLLKRIQADEASFFVPCDLEISIQELSYLVKKAEQWRGISGERRKVVVYDYIWEDYVKQSDVSSGEFYLQCETLKSSRNSESTTVHVVIYTVHLGGLEELYRHFLRLPSGAIVEAFGDVSGIRFAFNEVGTDTEEHRSGMDHVLGTSSEVKLRRIKKEDGKLE